MKASKIIWLVSGGIVLLVVLLVGIAFVPAVQTWAVRKAAAGQPGLKIEVGRVAVGLSTAEIRDLRLSRNGLIVTARRIFAGYSAWDYLRHKRVNVERIEVQGLGIDTRQMPATASTATVPQPAKPAAAPASKQPPFPGFLHMAQLPVDVRLADLAIDGRAVLPGDRTVDYTLQGGGIETGRRGQIAWKIDYSDSTKGAVVPALHASGSIGLHIAPDLRIDLIELENTAVAEGAKLPAEGLEIGLKAEQAAREAKEIYTAGASLVRGGKSERILNSRVEYLADANRLDGTWDLAVHSEQIAALLAGLGLPEISADGSGRFSFQPGAAGAVASGELNVCVAGLEKLVPRFPDIGPLQLHTAYDGAFAGNVARLNQLELELGTTAGRKLLQIGMAQPVSFDVATRRFAFAKPGAELAHVTLKDFPLAWAQPAVKPLTIESGGLSAAFSIMAEADGSQVHLTTVQPVTFAGVTLSDGERKLVDQLSLTLSPAVDYSAAKVTVNVPDLNLALPAGDAAAGSFRAEVTNLAATPVINFSAQLQERLTSVIRPFLPFDPGPIMIESAIEGRLQGQTLQLARFASTVKLRYGTLLASIETLQPLKVDFATVRIAAANPAAVAARIRLGELPLALAEPMVPKSDFSGTLSGATFEINLPADDQIAVQTAGPVSLRGISVAIGGKPLVKDLDLDIDLSAAKRGGTMSADVRRIELRQGTAVLIKLTGSGEATRGAALNASGKGRLDADLAALMRQPALSMAAVLSRGNLAADFKVVSGDPLKVKAGVVLRNLIARQGDQPLGDFDCQVDASLKADCSAGTVKIPLALSVGGRRSDLTFDGSFSRNASALSFTGKLGSAQIVVDDFQALAALAPQSPAAIAPAEPKPAGGNQETPKPAAGQGTAAPEAAAPARDTEPFWKGIKGRFDADLKLVKYGRDYTVRDIRCAAAIDETRLALNNLEGKFKDNAFRITAGITFTAADPRPYTMTGSVSIPGFDVGGFLRAANPKEAPAIETKVTIDAKLNGRGATVPDLAQNAYGQFDVSGTKGVLRALSNKGRNAAGLASAGLGLLGAARGSDTSSALGELTGYLNEMPFDHLAMRVNRGADLNLILTSLEFISPGTRLTGHGTIQHQNGVSIVNQPLHVEVQLAAKDHMALLLGKLNLLGQQRDDKGYTLMNSPFAVGGTIAKTDNSQLWRIVGKAALTSVVPAASKLLEGLLGR